MINNEFIIPSEPKIDKPDFVKVFRAETALRKAVQKNQTEGNLNCGISKQEAETILNWAVFNTRIGLQQDLDKGGRGEVLATAPLTGACGFAQSLTGFPLESMGLDVRVTNIKKCISPEAGTHAFLVVGIPIKGKEVEERFYLIDPTVRQFLISDRCNQKRFYSDDERFKGKSAPDPGYFMTLSQEGRTFTTELSRNGFIELTPENAKIYGDAFLLSGKGLDFYGGEIPDFKSYKTGVHGKTYIERFKTYLDEHDYDREEFEEWGHNLETPYEKMKANVKDTLKSAGKDMLNKGRGFLIKKVFGRETQHKAFSSRNKDSIEIEERR